VNKISLSLLRFLLFFNLVENSFFLYFFCFLFFIFFYISFLFIILDVSVFLIGWVGYFSFVLIVEFWGL
jgi:hypothetical protein